MKVVEHDFDSNPNPLEVIANAMGGVVEGNTVKGDNDLFKGTYLILNIEEQVTGILIDIAYKENILLKHKVYDNGGFVGLYFYQFNSDVDLISNERSIRFEKLGYDFLIADGLLNSDIIVKKHSKAYAVCITITKVALREYLKKIRKYTGEIVFDTKNAKIKSLERMNHQSQILIDNFRKIAPDSPSFETSFKALIYGLINNYLKQIKTKKISIGEEVSDDVKRIITSQKFLQNNNEGIFPGIDFLANEALMSATKYKKMFNKTLGVSPAVYFSNSKLEKAKELLETREFTVGEVSEKLNYSNASYLSKKFSEVYGVSPKEYQNLL